METINPKSMFTKGQTAYSIALLSYKDDETEKIITHTISKVGRSFVYDEKETKYHYSNKYKAFISADAFHHQQAIFPTEKAVQEYLERSRLYFDLIRLNSHFIQFIKLFPLVTVIFHTFSFFIAILQSLPRFL